jgi:hypothetical protein
VTESAQDSELTGTVVVLFESVTLTVIPAAPDVLAVNGAVRPTSAVNDAVEDAANELLKAAAKFIAELAPSVNECWIGVGTRNAFRSLTVKVAIEESVIVSVG